MAEKALLTLSQIRRVLGGKNLNILCTQTSGGRVNQLGFVCIQFTFFIIKGKRIAYF